MTASVNTSQPRPAWLAGCPSSTVRQVFNSSTPRRAQSVRLPPGLGNVGNGVPRSRCSSLNILRNDGGGCTPGATENASPSAWPRPWYGSCPKITTRTASGAVSSSARSGLGGKMAAPAANRPARNACSRTPCGAPKKSRTSPCQPGATGQCAGSTVCSCSGATTSGLAPTAVGDGADTKGSAKKFCQRFAGFGHAHKGLPHQKRVDTRRTHTQHIIARLNPTLRYQ